MTITELCQQHSNNVALRAGDLQLSYGELLERVENLAFWLRENRISCVALKLENSLDWVIWDLACQQADIICVPVPVFFSDAQQSHLLQESGAQLLVIESVRSINLSPEWQTLSQFDSAHALWFKPDAATALIPTGTQKITFTSGSTGSPKGVCLSKSQQWQVAQSLCERIAIEQPRHLVLLPLATLLENVAGIYAPLLAQGEVILANDEARGFKGSQLQDPQRLLQLISITQPDTLILVPELLMLLVQACQQGWRAPASLRFIAVGGSKVNPQLLALGRRYGLPVYEGYGLSECCSVVTLNTASDDVIGTVGSVLPHCSVSLEDGELVVSGSVFLGYVNQADSFYPKAVRTGDLAEWQEQHLVIKGRSKNQFINSYGRNFSPEWIEAQFTGISGIQQCVVQGDNLPYCSALIYANEQLSDTQLSRLIETINRELPDYAQVRRWQRLPAPLNQYPNLLTSNGKLKRDAISHHFSDAISQLYRITTRELQAAAPAPSTLME